MSSLNSSSVLPSTLAACPPLIDIASFLERSSAPDDVCIASSATGDALLDSAARFGYAHLTGHGIPCDVTSRLLHVSQHFFSSCARAELTCAKTTTLALSPPTYRGYQEVGENVTQGRRDAHRALDVLRTLPPESACLASPHVRADGTPLRALACGKNKYPCVEMERTADEFTAAAVRAALAVITAIRIALRLPEHAFADAFQDPFYLLRLIHYPAREGDTDDLGCGAHRDYGCITLIISDEKPGSASALQVCRTGEDDVYESAIVPPAGAVLINFGDCLETLTAGLLPATLHRVVRPDSERTSIAAFIEPTFSWRIKPISALSTLDSTPRPLFASAASAEGYQHRLADMQKHSCYGAYLLSKVSSNFSLYDNCRGEEQEGEYS